MKTFSIKQKLHDQLTLVGDLHMQTNACTHTHTMCSLPWVEEGDSFQIDHFLYCFVTTHSSINVFPYLCGEPFLYYFSFFLPASQSPFSPLLLFCS